MSEIGIPTEIRQFIFDHIDSVEQIEVLIFLRKHRQRSWTIQAITEEFRSSRESISSRISGLQAKGLVLKDQAEPEAYRYMPVSHRLDDLVGKVANTYEVRKHKVMEIIFSPAKKARPFANSFIFTKTPKDTGDQDG